MSTKYKKFSYWGKKALQNVTTNVVDCVYDTNDADDQVSTEEDLVLPVDNNVENNSLLDDCLYDEPINIHEDTRFSESEDDGIEELDESVVPFVETDGENDDQTLEQRLAHWATKFNVSLLCLSALLVILRYYYPSLPKTSKTLMNFGNPKHDIVLCGSGKYIHFGLLEQITRRLQTCGRLLGNSLTLLLNVDGFQPFVSSKMTIWPILGYIKEMEFRRPFIIGVYAGKTKPDDVDEFLKFVISDLRGLFVSGIWHMGNIYPMRLMCVICDAPARSLVKKSMGHNAIDACDFCTCKGIRHHNKTVYPVSNNLVRRGEPGSENAGGHFKGISPFYGIISLRDGFPPEYMHLLCLGIVKKLLTYWIKPNIELRLACKLRPCSILDISMKMDVISYHFPREFQRKVRNLSYFDKWKASEHKNFLLYVGPIVMKGLLPTVFYEHFLLLHFAIYVFLDDELCVSLFDQATFCIELFVKEAENLYTRDCLTYNMHVAYHLPYFVSLYGPLHCWSAFPFEGFMCFLQKRLRSPTNILNQIWNRSQEIWLHGDQLQNVSVSIAAKTPNNCLLTIEGTVIFVTEKCGTLLSGYVMVFKKNLYDYPYPSCSLMIGVYKKTNTFVTSVTIKKKCICYPLADDEFIVIPYASMSSFYCKLFVAIPTIFKSYILLLVVL
jgi:hypothetical protein